LSQSLFCVISKITLLILSKTVIYKKNNIFYFVILYVLIFLNNVFYSFFDYNIIIIYREKMGSVLLTYHFGEIEKLFSSRDFVKYFIFLFIFLILI